LIIIRQYTGSIVTADRQEGKMYETVLVPLDGSELAEYAILYAKTIATRMKSKIIVLSACGEEERSEHDMRAYLEKKTEELQASGLEATSVVTCGHAADEILGFAKKNDIDLIIMSTHGRSGISRWVTGSVSNKVMQESYIPLLLIKTNVMPRASETGESWRILVPLDGSEFSEASLPHATGMANGPNCEIILFRVNEVAEVSLYFAPELMSGWERYVEQARLATNKHIQSYLQRMSEKLQSEGLSVRSVVGSGRAAQEIVKYAESYDIDMIAMTTHGRSGFSHWPYGSVANKVIHGTSKPTLLIHPKPKTVQASSCKSEDCTLD